MAMKMDGLNKSQVSMLKKHKEHHSIKHMKEMIIAMKGGMSFKKAHDKAMKKVGK